MRGEALRTTSMKHCCKNCQFLSEFAMIAADIEKRPLSWNKDERESLSLPAPWAAECSEGIWSTGIDPDLKPRLKEVLTQDREDRCFFVEVHEGMSNQGARALHKLRNDDARQSQTHRLAKMAVGIAIGSLLVSIVTDIVLRVS